MQADVIDRASRMLQSGLPPREIKMMIPGIRGYKLTLLTQKLGLPKWRLGRPPGQYALFDRVKQREIERRLRNGENKAGIARSLGVSRQRVIQLLFPEKERARVMVKAALANRTLIKSRDCADCFAIKRIEAHHENYDKPLEVTWLCVQCHHNRHR